MARTFIRTKENFVCEHCGVRVLGDGYTNHCPQCLYSKHVDIHPGDRASDCGGLMKPTAIEGIVDHYSIISTCLSCGATHRNKVQKDDSSDAIVALAQYYATKHARDILAS